jgi:DNA invertase Pin-like site-specific DNA recombinase
MTYGYIRVSSDKQTVENQRFEIERFCLENDLKIEQWIEETNSGSKIPEKRLLGPLLAGVQKGDLIICSELSRLGRSLFMIMSILNHLMLNGVRVWTIKDNYRLGDNIQSKVLAFAFGLSAEIERDLISQRTKEALARKRFEGKILGRPYGSKSTFVKLSGCELDIQVLLRRRFSKTAIGRIYSVNRMTVGTFVRERIQFSGDLELLLNLEEYPSLWTDSN